MDWEQNSDYFVNPLPNETRDDTNESQFDSIEEDSPIQIEVNNKKKRGENFTVEEDIELVKCWLGTSMDSIIGNDQKMTTFWNRVSDSYSLKTISQYPQRTETSLASRWQLIQKAVNKFQGFYTQLDGRKPSGTRDQETFVEAKKMYKKIQKSAFSYDECWKLLRKEPKWRTHISNNYSKRKFSETCTKPININESPISANAYADLERPIGKKAAKEKLKREKKGDSSGDISCLAEWKEEKKKMHIEKMSIQEKKIKIEEERSKMISRELEMEQKKFEMNIMLMDTSSMDDVQKSYIESSNNQILAKTMM